MLQPNDINILAKKGISKVQFEEQLACFTQGFPYLQIKKAADLNEGILAISETEKEQYISTWENYVATDKKIIKFVPASGAASRMFKDLFEFIDADYEIPTSNFEQQFFTEITRFAFYDSLNKACVKKTSKQVKELLENKQYKTIIKVLLEESGLNYGNLPKGLLQFHKYNSSRTPLEEHLVEGALYAQSNGKVILHFTVSPEHRALFEQLVEDVVSNYEQAFNVRFNITFSEQKTATDTIAANDKNEPFRENGALVFRPGGHGALIENLNELEGDIIFIKNIDNVVPDKYKESTVENKKLIAGILVATQQKTFDYLKTLEDDTITDSMLNEIFLFCNNTLNIQQANFSSYSRKEKIDYLSIKLHRPIRVCGMVKNEGEPGGGPYLVKEKDGSVAPQILESSQINTADPTEKELMQSATHFNPVDLVCSIKDYRGNKFNLPQYVDKQTGFISIKSKNGKVLKALELPGLWNGAMSNWNTIFVEVPIATFNPVKTVNDLLRKEHQG